MKRNELLEAVLRELMEKNLKPVSSLLGEDVPEDNDTDWQFVTLGEQVSVYPVTCNVISFGVDDI